MSNGEELSLLPCPFCGGTAEWYDITEADEVGNAGGSCIICTKCQACGPVQFGEKDTIVDQWNRRSSPSAVDAAEVVGWQPGERALAFKWATKLLAKLSTKPDHADDCLWLVRLSDLFASPPPASPSAPQGVEVKPLVWRETDENQRGLWHWEAGDYGITKLDWDGFSTYDVARGHWLAAGPFKSLDAAKAAAQADYRARILSAIQTSPEGTL